MTELNGVDIASYQAAANAGSLPGEFVIVKATESVDYVNPYCDTHFHQAKNAGKLLATYHFARPSYGNSPVAEAEYYVRNTEGYHGLAIPILDWEDGNTVGNISWAHEWMDWVRSRVAPPMAYMSESVVISHDWRAVSADNYGLWVAKYRDYVPDYNYNMELAGNSPVVDDWPFYAMWQWTSVGRLNGYGGNIDCNRFYGDADAWNAYVSGNGVTPSPNPIPPAPQPAPNNTYTVRSGDTLSAIASVFGTTWEHLAAINGLANPHLIYAGQVLRVSGEVQTRTHVVGRGENLSSIAAKYGTSWQTLQRINGIPNADLIFPGQIIRLP